MAKHINFTPLKRFYVDTAAEGVPAPSTNDDFPPPDRVIVTRDVLAVTAFQQAGQLVIIHRDTNEHRDTRLHYQFPAQHAAAALVFFSTFLDNGKAVTLADLDQAMVAIISKAKSIQRFKVGDRVDIKGGNKAFITCATVVSVDDGDHVTVRRDDEWNRAGAKPGHEKVNISVLTPCTGPH